MKPCFLHRLFARPLAVFLLTVLVFLMAPVNQSLDSRYSLMVSQNLIDRGSFRLNDIPGLAEQFPYYRSKGNFELVNGNFYYLFPNASSLLSVPYVAAMNLFDGNVINPDGTFNTPLEVRLQRGLASLLMATLAAVIFMTSRLWLPVGWSWLVTLTAAFGTQIFSTATRSLWSHTWGLLLLGTAIYLLARHLRGAAMNPYLLATLVSWAYFVRPTFSVSIIIISAYVLLNVREVFLRYAVTGITWFALFVGYSWYNYGKPLPTYFAGGRLGSGTFWEAVAGNLVSPARGVLIYSPFILVVIALLVIYRHEFKSPRLVALACAAILLHLTAISTFPHWWAGHSYGPRLMTDVIPWIMLLAVLGIDAMRTAHSRENCAKRSAAAAAIRYTFTSAAALLILFSVFTHSVGAWYNEAHGWNTGPQNVDKHPERLWDWHDLQFMRR